MISAMLSTQIPAILNAELDRRFPATAANPENQQIFANRPNPETSQSSPPFLAPTGSLLAQKHIQMSTAKRVGKEKKWEHSTQKKMMFSSL